jgi:hypothetical protein
VRDEFAAVAAGEPGLTAQLAAYRHGELVVDLWTGLARRHGRELVSHRVEPVGHSPLHGVACHHRYLPALACCPQRAGMGSGYQINDHWS